MPRVVFPVVALLAAASLTANGEDAPPRSAELQVLERLVGDWETETVVQATGDKLISRESRRWSRAGKFILSEDFDVASGLEAHFLVTYDPKAQQYRACFMNGEAVVPLLGTWDEDAQTMTWKSTDVAFQHAGVHRFLDADHVEWTMTVTSPEGQVVLELSAKQTRHKPSAAPR